MGCGTNNKLASNLRSTDFSKPLVLLVKTICYPESTRFYSKACDYILTHETDALHMYLILLLLNPMKNKMKRVKITSYYHWMMIQQINPPVVRVLDVEEDGADRLWCYYLQNVHLQCFYELLSQLTAIILTIEM